jgi:hypothetical protein
MPHAASCSRAHHDPQEEHSGPPLKLPVKNTVNTLGSRTEEANGETAGATSEHDAAACHAESAPSLARCARGVSFRTSAKIGPAWVQGAHVS